MWYDIKSRKYWKKYEVNFYSNLDSMFENNEDIAVILTDSGSHYDVFKSIQKYKKRHSWKPMALKLEHTNMIQISEENECKLL